MLVCICAFIIHSRTVRIVYNTMRITKVGKQFKITASKSTLKTNKTLTDPLIFEMDLRGYNCLFHLKFWKKNLFKNMEMGNSDPKHSYNFMYRHTEFSPEMDLLEGDVCIQE